MKSAIRFEGLVQLFLVYNYCLHVSVVRDGILCTRSL